MSKILLRHTLTKKFLHFGLLYLYTFSLYENASLIIVSAETEYIANEEKTNDYENFEKGMIYMKILKKGG